MRPALLRRRYPMRPSKFLTTLILLAGLYRPAGAATVARAPYAADSGSIAVRCGTLIDGLARRPAKDRLVVIREGRVESVLAGSADPDRSLRYLDLTGFTCLPGLIDTHTHMVEYVVDTADLSVYFRRTIAETSEIARINAEKTLLAGFTTVRNLGAYSGWAGRELRDRVAAGEVVGPRMQVAGFYLTVPGGGGDLLLPGYEEQDIPERLRMGVARGPAEFREKAQQAVDGGADVLKIIASGAVLAIGGVPGSPEMTPEEIAAVVEVAHAAGINVTAHAHGAQSVKEAILAGVDSVEHASLADAESIALAAERQVAFSMDIYSGDYIDTQGREQNWPEEFLRKNLETVDVQRRVFSDAYRSGVTIIYGTDAGTYPHGDNAGQLAFMVQHGMTPIDAIKAATSVAAEHIGWGDRVGAIEAGRYGDLIAVRGDPLADVAVLEAVNLVIKGGLVFKLTADPEL